MTDRSKLEANQSGSPGDVVAVKEALKPFAKLAEWGDGKHLHFPQPGVSQEIDGMFVGRPDDRVIFNLAPGCPTITLGDLRRARAAIDAVSGVHTTPSTAMNKQRIVDLIRENYDPIPSDWPRHRAWDDGADDIADAILSEKQPVPSQDESRCPKCNLEAGSLLHRFCTHDKCPVRTAALSSKIAAAETSPGDVAVLDRIARIIDPHSFMDIPFTDDPSLLDMVEQSKGDALRKAERILTALNVKAETKSQEPVAELTGQFSVREFREDAFRSMEVQICSDTRTVQFGVEDNGGDHPTMPCCAISWTDAVDLASWVQSCITHPTTKPEAPAVSVDAIARLVDPRAFEMDEAYSTTFTRTAVARAHETATAIAALIDGEQ